MSRPIDARDAICGWCKTALDLSDESGTAWVECDLCNLCRPCYDALMDGTPGDFAARHVPEVA
jgi:hypothetical protein